MRRRSPIAPSFFEILEPRLLWSGVPLGPPFVVADGVGGAPRVEARSDGSFVVLFGREAQDGFDLFARVLDSSGAPISGEVVVNPGLPALTFDLAMDGDGDFAVAFDAPGSDARDVFVRRFGSDGTPAGDAQQVNGGDTGDQGTVAIAMDADGDFVVAWQGPGPEKTILFREQERYSYYEYFYDDPNTPEYEQIKRRSTTPEIVTDTEQAVETTGVFARRYDSSGAALGDPFQVSTQTPVEEKKEYRNAFNPSVAMDVDGDFIVGWVSVTIREKKKLEDPAQHDCYEDPYTGGGELCYGYGPDFSNDFRIADHTARFRRYDSAGVVGGEEGEGFSIEAFEGAAESGITALSVEADPDGDYFLVAALTREYRKRVVENEYGSETVYDFEGSKVTARRYDSVGNPIGKPLEVRRTDELRAISGIDADIDTNGDWLIAWDESEVAPEGGNAVEGTGVLARRYNDVGQPVGTTFPLDEDGDASGPAVSFVGTGRFVAAFAVEDAIGGEVDVAARLFQGTYPFGKIGPRKRVKLKLTDDDGTVATFNLRGPGSGFVVGGLAPFTVVVSGTTSKSRLIIGASGGADGVVELGDVTIGSEGEPADLKSLVARRAVLRGEMDVFGSLGVLRLRGMEDARVNVQGEFHRLRLAAPGSIQPSFVNSRVEAVYWTGKNRLGVVRTTNGGVEHGLFAGLFESAVFFYTDEGGKPNKVLSRDGDWLDRDFAIEELV